MSGELPSGNRSPWIFFALVFALAVPFWWLGATTNQGLLASLGVNLPLSALAFVCPITAAVILTYRDAGLAGVAALLRRSLDPKRIRHRIWYLPIILLLPLLYSLSYGIMRLLGVPLTSPHVSFVTLSAMFGLFFIAAACEEVGWSGYALGPLQERWGALRAALWGSRTLDRFRPATTDGVPSDARSDQR